MRTLLSASALVCAMAFVSPASAQMCGSGQAQVNGSSAGMCGMSAPAPAGDAQAEGSQSGCSCCQNMAMMQMPMEGQGADGAQDPSPMMDMPAPDAPQE